MKTAAKISEIVTNVITAVIILVMLAFFVPKVFFGINPYIVLSGSMEPTIHTGSVVFINTKDTDIETDDIVAYYLTESTDESEGTVVTHRVIEGSTAEGYFVTKGDANEDSDMNNVTQDQIIGTYIFSVPKVGYIVSSFESYTFSVGSIEIPFGVFVVIFLIIFLNVLTHLLYYIAEDDDEEDEDEEENDGKGKAKKSFAIPVSLAFLKKKKDDDEEDEEDEEGSKKSKKKVKKAEKDTKQAKKAKDKKHSKKRVDIDEDEDLDDVDDIDDIDDLEDDIDEITRKRQESKSSTKVNKTEKKSSINKQQKAKRYEEDEYEIEFEEINLDGFEEGENEYESKKKSSKATTQKDVTTKKKEEEKAEESEDSRRDFQPPAIYYGNKIKFIFPPGTIFYDYSNVKASFSEFDDWDSD